MNTVITAESGVHGHAVPHAAARFVERHLEAHGVVGKYTLRWGSPLPIRHGAPFVARRINADKHNIELILTLRSNGASHVAWLSPDGPAMNGNGVAATTLADIFAKLAAPPAESLPSSNRSGRGDDDAFIGDPERVHAALSVIRAAGPNVDAVKRALARQFVEIGTDNRAWGQVLGWLARKGLVAAERHSYGGLKAVRLSTHGAAVLGAVAPSITPTPPAPLASTELGRHLSGELARLRREEDALTMAVLERGERLSTLDRELTELRASQDRDERRLSTVTACIAAVQLLSREDGT